MATSALRRTVTWGAEHAPWSAAARQDTLFIAAGVPLGLPTLSMAAFVRTGSIGVVGVLVGLALNLICLDLLTTAQRSRFRSLRGLEVPIRLPANADWVVRLRAGMTWRQAVYHLLAAPLFAAAALTAILAGGVGLVMATSYGWAVLMPLGSALRAGPAWTSTDGVITAGGIALLFAIPWVSGWLAGADERAVRALLGPNRAEVLEQRVEDLAESRAGVVDAADAERRRIERDLHDGAQQRLVSLAMNLGLARRTLRGVRPDAMQVIVEAHEEAQAAIVELRDLVRGLHPVVLEDRGLDAALSGIAARAPVPVRLRVELPDRLAATIEAVAYFTVSEALANVAKHARASRVDLSVRQRAGRLCIVVTDDGVGGADTATGTGLVGLRKRAASVDGTFAIISPLGGPTTITVELPCEL
ncbi:sensor histidine kinase [Kitasatospora sp. MAP5-34]|uniref:sensor histidine kinase n=1 Tax=Kitasatospora sp. MAP5-34 TaxID=3035102 RepID=UPI002474BAB5|nr:sensor histidine kinase [Kitasatospora sp. MAP5-34]MDH6574841.1 signal transduction histidine kinase [Kitasatospora sp. MAP5-34]